MCVKGFSFEEKTESSNNVFSEKKGIQKEQINKKNGEQKEQVNRKDRKTAKNPANCRLKR